MKAIWNGVIVAESEETIEVESNNYFPPQSIRKDYFKPSPSHSTCPWKGKAHYYHLEVEGRRNEDAAWYYPKAKPLAAHIENYVAFWNGVEVIE